MTQQTRLESDSLGFIEVPIDRYWGAQTERARHNFPSGSTRFVWQRPFIRALGIVKRCCALANLELGELKPKLAQSIIKASEDVVAGYLDDHFPLGVFQSGSGTQSNMNANEVIGNRAIELLGGVLGSKTPIHPNDHVNRCQSSNDVFPSAMHIAIVTQICERYLPAVDLLRETFAAKAAQYQNLVKTGRTHLQDAAPITVSQEISGWVAQLEYASEITQRTLQDLYFLAIGGTAVGTGLNAHVNFGAETARAIADFTGIPFQSAPNKFFALSCHDPLVTISAATRTLAVALLKIANDIRWLASGPRCGLGELTMPVNEPGSSIMPGKANPTQCEALAMVCAQVLGNDTTVAFGGSQGNFQLNTFKPVIAHKILESIELLSDVCLAFNSHCAAGITPVPHRISEHLSNNIMLATALTPHIGYDRASHLAKTALETGKTLKEAAAALHILEPDEFDRLVVPHTMTHHEAP